MIIMIIMLLFTMLQNTRIQSQDMPSLHMELHWRKSLGFILLITQLFQSLCISQTTIHQSQLIMLPSLNIIHQSQLIMNQSLDITQSLSMGMVA